MGLPEIFSANPVVADGDRLLAVADLPASQVTEVETEQHGTLAVGIADGEPFAVSNLCRHQLAKLGRGQVRDGCLECPWHRARYDVRSGRMTQGPQGRIFGFAPYSESFKAAGQLLRLRRFPVAIRDGVIVLSEPDGQ